ncbi:MAG: SIS domain-containing protein [Rhizobiaceae bacterium]
MNDPTRDAPTQMWREIRQIPAALERLIEESSVEIERAAERLRQLEPSFVTTIARGSSDHCASYLKYAIEIHAGLAVASLGPSVASIYGAKLRLANSLGLAISQSGGSPDIVESARQGRLGGALTIAITNDTGSALANVCDYTFDIAAGPEKSVAATKTFVNSLAAGLLLLAHWLEDGELLDAMHALPGQCAEATSIRWDGLLERMADEDSLYVLGRGPTYSIANEVALKFKETCQIHAESYSAAEVMHGPVSIVGQGFPVLVLAGRDATREATAGAIERLVSSGADVHTTAEKLSGTHELATVATGHPLTDPLSTIVSFYAFIEELARRRGMNPDQPPHLAKVTKTV